LPVVLYGCETWTHTLREECTLRVFKNRVLRRIFGSEGDKVPGGGDDYITSSSVLLTRYHSGDQVRKTERGGTGLMYGGEVRCIQGFSGET
jgi:hypothetical protein